MRWFGSLLLPPSISFGENLYLFYGLCVVVVKLRPEVARALSPCWATGRKLANGSCMDCTALNYDFINHTECAETSVFH
jgi:hypothetical protein